MRQKDVLAEHLKGLLAASKFNSLPKITAASRDRLSNGTLDRIRRAESEAGIDKLEELADVFRIQPWLLMVPGVRYVAGDEGYPVVANTQEVLESLYAALIDPAVERVSNIAQLHTGRHVKAGKSPNVIRKDTVSMGSTASPISARKQAVLDALVVRTGSDNEPRRQPNKISKSGTNRRN